MRLSEKDKEEVRSYVVEKIEEISKSKFDDQSKLISAAVQNAIQPLMNEIATLRELLEKTCEQNESLQSKLLEKNAKIANLKQSVIAATQRNVALHSLILEKADENEQYSRKDSLRISGIAITNDEDNASLQQSVITKLGEHGVQIENNDIYRLHRSSKPQPMNNFNKYLNKINKRQLPIDQDDYTETSEVIVRFTRWAPRSRVYDLHYKHDLPIKVKCDLTKFRQDLLKVARQYLEDKKLKGYVYSTGECKLCIKNCDTGKRLFFSNFDDFKFKAASLVEDPGFYRRQNRNVQSPTGAGVALPYP